MEKKQWFRQVTDQLLFLTTNHFSSMSIKKLNHLQKTTNRNIYAAIFIERFYKRS